MTNEQPPRMVTLQAANPVPPIPGFWAVVFPGDSGREEFALIRQQIEFRRKCMNQGFDNLLELVQMHEDAFLKGGRVPDDLPMKNAPR